jgi:succinate dehydrogenase flavin-adding protein (antitoxin of CptAB toxin-antitoxin module)
MSGSNDYSQYVGDVDEIEMLLEEEDEDILNEIIKKTKKNKKKRFDDGTSVKDNPMKQDKKYKLYK